MPVLRHRLRRDGRRRARAGRRRARRRGQPGQPRAAVREGLSPAGPALRRGPPALPAAAQRRRLGFARISWDEALDLIATRVRRDAEAARPRRRRHVRLGPVDGVRRLRRAEMGQGRPAQQQPRTQRPAVHGERRVGLHHAVPERRADGLLRRPRPRPTTSCSGATTWPRCTRCSSAAFWRRKRQKPGARIVDIATRRTPTTDYADLLREFKPGTDLALANGILHLLVARGTHRRRRSSTRTSSSGAASRTSKTIGYGCFDEQAERYTFEDEPRDELARGAAHVPRRLHAGAGRARSPACRWRRSAALADIYGDLSRGTVSLWCMGVNQHVRGTWMNNLITDLHLITGKICRPGNNPLSLTGQPSACGTAREVGTLEQPPAGRHGGDQPRAPRRGRADLEAAGRHDSRQARAITRSTCSAR